MGLFGSRTADRAVAPVRPPRDIEALEEFVTNLEKATDEASTWRIYASTYAEFYDMEYAGVWLVDNGQPHLEFEAGRIPAALAGTQGQPGLVQQAIRTRAVAYVEDTSTDQRMAAAFRAGASAAVIVPVLQRGTVTAVMEYYIKETVAVDNLLISKWQAISRVAEQARVAALTAYFTRQIADDRLAVTNVVTALGNTSNSQVALQSALDAVCKAFGWAYGSYWEIDPEENVLKFRIESGSAGEEFRKVTLAATFAEGVGLSGRAWRARDLIFVRDIGELTDCVRAPAAQRGGVRSGVCFPIVSMDRIIGTMDFFTTDVLDELSDSRTYFLPSRKQRSSSSRSTPTPSLS